MPTDGFCEKDLKAKQEREREAAKTAGASKAANARVHSSLAWLWAALSRGEGPETVGFTNRNGPLPHAR